MYQRSATVDLPFLYHISAHNIESTVVLSIGSIVHKVYSHLMLRIYNLLHLSQLTR